MCGLCTPLEGGLSVHGPTAAVNHPPSGFLPWFSTSQAACHSSRRQQAIPFLHQPASRCGAPQQPAWLRMTCGHWHAAAQCGWHGTTLVFRRQGPSKPRSSPSQLTSLTRRTSYPHEPCHGLHLRDQGLSSTPPTAAGLQFCAAVTCAATYPIVTCCLCERMQCCGTVTTSAES